MLRSTRRAALRHRCSPLAAIAVAPWVATCAGTGPGSALPYPAPPAIVEGPRSSEPFDPAAALAAPLDASEAAFAAALEAEASGAWGHAAEAWARVAGDPAHPLAPWAELRLAERLLDADPTHAARFADAAAARHGWPGVDEARWLAAQARLAAGDATDAAARYAALLEATPTPRLPHRRVAPWATHLARSSDPTDRVLALRLRRRLAAAAPHRSWGSTSAAEADALHAGLPPALRAETPSWTAEERLERGEALDRARRYEEALDELAAAVHGADRAADVPLACRARLALGRTLDRARRRRDAAETLEALLGGGCRDPDVLATARFLAGRCRARAGDVAAGRGHYEALVERFPEHRLADDAALKIAILEASAGDADAARASLEAIPGRFPGGDLVGEARFRAAMAARDAGDVDAALSHLEAIDRAGGEDGEDTRGRAGYWRARTLEEAGRTARAVRAYADLARAHPLTYHGQRAVQRLDALDPTAAEKLRGWLGEGLVETAEDDGLVFEVTPGLRTPGFRRALALLRVGAPELARRELAAVPWGDGHDAEATRSRRFLLATLLHAAGDVESATRLVRNHFPDRPPVGAARALWRLAYPRAWSPEIETAAAEAGVPPSLVRAIAREESGFSPAVVSPARAYGLLQIVRPTARPIARDLGLPSGPRALKRPEVNLRIGATLLARLVARYDPHAGLVPAAYNAGAGATDRWLRERGGVPFDRWVEEIPYDETRRYTRRVLQTWGIYALLDEGALPRLPDALP